MTDHATAADRDPVLVETIEGVCWITLNRPDKLNALNPRAIGMLRETLRNCARDGNVASVVLTGAGRGFCAGGDLKQRQAADQQAHARAAAEHKPKSYEEDMDWLRRAAESSVLLREMPKPTIAMINGPCAGAGLSLAGACDFRIAGRSAAFVSAFAHAGLSGDFGGSWFWTRILGPAKARELYLLSNRFDAEQALAFGLVNKVVEDDRLRETVDELARRFAGGAPATYRYIKANLSAAEEVSLHRLIEIEVQNHIDARRAMR